MVRVLRALTRSGISLREGELTATAVQHATPMTVLHRVSSSTQDRAQGVQVWLWHGE